MTQPTLWDASTATPEATHAGSRLSKLEAVAQYFRARPGQWIPAPELMKLGGMLAWRTRVSDLRKPPYAMQIENCTRTDSVYGKTSYYIYRGHERSGH